LSGSVFVQFIEPLLCLVETGQRQSVCLSVAIDATSYLFHRAQSVLLETSSWWHHVICRLQTCPFVDSNAQVWSSLLLGVGFITSTHCCDIVV